MADDWYTTWLGVAPGERPPDYYALLCLPRFTSSPNAVEAAARAQMEKLDPHAMHPERERREIATQMMNQIAQARMTLCDSSKRRQYDLQLAERLGIDPPTEDDDAMGETIAGGSPMGLDALDVSALEAGAGDAGGKDGDVTAPADMLPDSLFEGHAPLQDLNGHVPARHRHTPIPFNVILMIGGAVIGLITVVIAIIVLFAGGDGSAESASTAAVNTPPPVNVTPAPARPHRFVFEDSFEGAKLGRQYEVKTGRPEQVRIERGAMVLSAPDESTVRVDLTPHRTSDLFSDAAVTANIRPGAQFRFGIAATATLSVTHLGEGRHNVRVSIGTVLDTSGTSSAITLDNLDTLTIRLERDAGAIFWSINGRRVATSPQIPPRGTPTIELSAVGPPGDRCAIHDIRVTYAAE